MTFILETSFGDLTIDLYQDCGDFLNEEKIIKDMFVEKIDSENYVQFIGEQKIQRKFNERIIDKIGQLCLLKGSNKNEFFITLTDKPYETLKQSLCPIGQVVEGLDELMTLKIMPVDKKGKPLKKLLIEDFLIVEELREKKEKSSLEKIDMEKYELKNQEKVLEMVEYFPSDSKPDERTLFITKLNSKTQSQDLKEIFSQFGKINYCKIVKDWKTMKSLNYAFIEFENKESAEEAYFKMHNALIDNHRIHVDFSQSLKKSKKIKKLKMDQVIH